MKNRTRLLSGLLLGVLLVSSFGSALAIGDYSVSERIAHKFTEESWAIRYDVFSNKLVEDLTPGNYSDDLDETIPDQAPFTDAIFYIAYMNLGQVQTVYMAFDEFSRDTRNVTYSGVSPYQMIQQHFRTAAGKHVIVQNAFTGLVAYKENGTENGVPDRNDSLYYGDSLNNQLYKFYFNRLLSFSMGYAPFDLDVVPQAFPKILELSEDGDRFTYTFGMDYTNLFLIWYPINIPDDLNELTTGTSLLSHAVAFSDLAYLNFTYTLSGQRVEDAPTNITLTTEYDIGPITDLWIVNDDQVKAENIGGEYIDVIGTENDLAHYNTSEAITTRLSGTSELPGFSLAVSNYARIINIEATVEDAYDTEVVDDEGEIVDGEDANENVTSLDLQTADRPVYNIDFASKPDYILDDNATYDAPVKLYPHSRLRNPIINKLDTMAFLYLNQITRTMIQARIDFVRENLNLEGKQLTIDVSRRNIFYTICFPEWNGQSIWQDPTFTAYADPGTTSDGGFLTKINGYGIGILALAGFSISAVIIRKNRVTKQAS